MKILSIYHDSVCDGEGVRTVIFFAGCPHHCEGCHNPESWKMSNGNDFTVEDVLKECLENPLSNVTFSGGDPFLQAKQIIPLAKELKKVNKTIWAYTGWTYEELIKDEYRRELLTFVDVLVDGKFVLENRDPKLKFRGSPNQRILKLKDGEVVEDVSFK